MKTRTLLLWTLVGLAVAVGMLVLWTREARSRRGLHLLQATLDSVERDTHELELLRARKDHIGVGQRPREDLLAAINSGLGTLGVSGRTLMSLQPDSAGAPRDDAPGLRWECMRATFEPITLPDLGRFLEVWRRDQPLWAVSRIQLAPSRRGSESLAVQLWLSGAYVEEVGP
ncbi:MAG: hypothetical protein H6811_01525 [Phycisphaeraceae bacterium]|nr:hypothetical protein [Phycisphaeraceae bacterium]